MKNKDFPKSTTPGAVILHYIEDGLITMEELIHRMLVLKDDVEQLVNGDGKVTPELAVSLAVALHTSARFWLDLQDRYDAYQANERFYRTDAQRVTAAPGADHDRP